jgi:hypothetical protein
MDRGKNYFLTIIDNSDSPHKENFYKIFSQQINTLIHKVSYYFS